MPRSSAARLPESDPEPVAILDGELAHSVKGVVRLFHDLQKLAPAKPRKKRIDTIAGDVQVDFPAVFPAGLPAGAEHHLAVLERELGPIHHAVDLVAPQHLESDGLVPLHGVAHIGNVDHGNYAL